MSRFAAACAVFAMGVSTALAQPSGDELELGGSGAMSREALEAAPVVFELDIPYADTDNPRQRLDLYLPEEPAETALPVIIFLHGGGWRQGDKGDGAARVLPFVAGGDYAAVSAGYRLANEATWPAQLDDGKAAIRWVKAHADDHGLDPERIAVWGRGAGAHLALMLGLTGDAPELEGELGTHTDRNAAVAGVVNFFGVTDMPAMVDHPSAFDRSSPEAPEARLLGSALPDSPERAKAASPITYVSEGDPPVLTLHGTDDLVVPYEQAVRLDLALQDAGVISHFVTVPGAEHGDFPERAEKRVAAFLARVLRDEDVEVPTEPLEAPEE